MLDGVVLTVLRGLARGLGVTGLRCGFEPFAVPVPVAGLTFLVLAGVLNSGAGGLGGNGLFVSLVSEMTESRVDNR